MSHIPPQLTSREREVLYYIAYEYTNSQIATKLEISTSTVDSHREKLYLKLDVKKSASAIRRAYELGIFPMEL